MTITSKVQSQFFESEQQQLIRIAQDAKARVHGPTKRSGTPWSADEHDRFLRALEAHPSGPWKVIAWSVGTRTTRQTMTHAQKYREKIARHKRLGEQIEALTRCSGNFAYGTADSASANVNANENATATVATDVYKQEHTTDTSINGALGAGANITPTPRDLDDLFLLPDVDDDAMLDTTIALLLDSYEPLDIGEDDDDESFWRDLEAFAHTL